MVRCSGCGSPVLFMKWVSLMPRRSASRFISWAKPSSEPAISSASATQASLPDCTIMPCTSWSTVTGLRGSMNIREPIIFHAFSDTGTCCSGVIRPSLSAAKVR